MHRVVATCYEQPVLVLLEQLVATRQQPCNKVITTCSRLVAYSILYKTTYAVSEVQVMHGIFLMSTSITALAHHYPDVLHI